MSFNAERNFCNFCKNDFNCNNENIEDVKDLYTKYKINFNLCSACIFSFNTDTEINNFYKNSVKSVTSLIEDSTDFCQFKLELQS